MAHPHVITALVKRCAELTGQTDEARRKMVLDLENPDTTIP